MVAVVNAVSARKVMPVTLVAGEEASGLARIICQYLEQLFAESQEKRDGAAALHGRLGLRTREGDVAITVAFTEDGVAVEEGLRETDAVVNGEVEFLMHVLAGRANPAWEVCSGTVAFQPRPLRPLFGYQAYRVMRLPHVHLWSGLPRPPVGLLVGAAVLVSAVVLVRRRVRASGGGDA
jgi:hypothetical protein